MTTPLICTANTTGHVDYGIPISAYKSTDYRTSTGTYHRYIPPIPQDFDCRVKANVTKELLQSDPTLKDETFKTIYSIEYPTKQGDGNPSGYVPRPPPYDNMHYLRSVQEKVFKHPPPPLASAVSTTKYDYYRKYQSYEGNEVSPPDPNAYCEIKALGRDEQRPIRPEEKGYYRLMDTYMTTNRLRYTPSTKDQQDGLSRKDIITFYDASGVPRGGKGYGPKIDTPVEPIFRSKTEEMYDKQVFKTKAFNKIIPQKLKRIPHFGIQTEYQGKYTLQTFSDFYPYLLTSTERFPDSLSNASPWQNLAPPGMYCTECCHINGAPVRCIIDQRKPVECIDRDVALCSDTSYFPNETCH